MTTPEPRPSAARSPSPATGGDVRRVVADDRVAASRDDLLVKVGQRLREARNDAGMSQEQVSRQLGRGFSLASLYRWESGVDLPTFDKMMRLADLYGVSLDWCAGRSQCRPTFDQGKIVVDRDALTCIDEFARSGRRLEDLPHDLVHGPGLHCAWPVPHNPMILGHEAAESIEHHLREAYQVLRDGRG